MYLDWGTILIILFLFGAIIESCNFRKKELQKRCNDLEKELEVLKK